MTHPQQALNLMPDPVLPNTTLQLDQEPVLLDRERSPAFALAVLSMREPSLLDQAPVSSKWLLLTQPHTSPSRLYQEPLCDPHPVSPLSCPDPEALSADR